MPESKVRKEAAEKKVAKRQYDTAVKRGENVKKSVRLKGTRDWVPWVFVPLGLLGVIWLIVFYITNGSIWGMRSLGSWNLLIGIGCMAAAFIVSTAWK